MLTKESGEDETVIGGLEIRRDAAGISLFQKRDAAFDVGLFELSEDAEKIFVPFGVENHERRLDFKDDW